MIQHFQFQSLYSNKQLPGWSFSFIYKRKKYTGLYHPDGNIEWNQEEAIPNEEQLKEQIHALMLYHVYDH
ncbi:DUF5342 family protein [Heyndrickxia acidicola]|jgi:hypothetical protein|uniref:DUF5342 family protein n=1 Tax=Heyndrickxia acidicola TaxID=209389 RepID=A0ABU6MCM8_9BACI|nr:DUF5342 family protein [Heyndrickxia acidicola]MED1202411.1 DUF5342 family protein [Heyndrickxia acidicola]